MSEYESDSNEESPKRVTVSDELDEPQFPTETMVYQNEYISFGQRKKGKKQRKQKVYKQSSGLLRVFVVGFLGVLVGCIVTLGAVSLYELETSDGEDETSESSGGTETTVIGGEGDEETTGEVDEDATLAESVADKCLPSVCSVDVYTSTTSYYGFDLSTSSEDLTESSLGSGVVISEDGYIITNYHVIEDSDALEVTIDGTVYEAEVIGYDASSDIAVIKAQDASGLTAIELGDSDELSVGEWVMSIGSPFGLEQSVATGVVSATNRSQILDSSDEEDGEITIYTNMIQTDAAINPGNSGGALVNSDGQLIGINTLITSYSGNYSGVGFAIPANYAISIAEQLIAGETPTHASLGVSLSSLNEELSERYGISIAEGALVSGVDEGSGADEAGIQWGDVITAFNGEEITSASDLMLAVRSQEPGDVVTVTINRNGESMDLEVTLGSDEDE